jgi:hypothetical protein
MLDVKISDKLICCMDEKLNPRAVHGAGARLIDRSHKRA